ncbi:MAG: 3-dehydroquinate synthase, partial [Thermoanaerobaculales bacterium]
GAASRFGEILDREGVARPRSLVSDSTVGPLWGQSAAQSLGAPLIELADGEEHKRWQAVETLLGHWLDRGLHRGDSVLAIGGGVLTDTVGFAAAVFMRGIRWSAVPTTLLAMVDASVGGKTGVNLEQGKNLAGAFWPPRLVVVDVATLTTLPARELRAGMAEVVKTGWIGDRELLALLRSNPLTDHTSLSPEQWEDLVMRALAVKARVVAEDELEAGERKALNLGHTLGHALEAATKYRRFLHGEAVAWGLLAAARLSRRRGLLGADGDGELRAAVAALGTLPPIDDIGPEALRAHLERDKKRNAEGVGWVLPTDDGVVIDQRVTTEEALEVFEELQEGDN